jgi:uncharacterized protein involved in outer membrane biogenesis
MIRCCERPNETGRCRSDDNDDKEDHVRTGLKRLGWILAAVLGLWLVAWLGVPPLLAAQVERHASAALGRPVTVGRVDFRPWTLELTVEQLAVGPAPGAAASAPLLTVERLYANADARSLLHLAPVLTALEVDAPVLRLTRTAPGHYDIDDLIARFAAPTAEPAAPDSAPPRFALHNLQLRGGAVHVDDQPLGRQHALTGLTLALPFLSNLPAEIDTEVTPRLAFTLDGDAFDASARARPFAPGHTTQARFALPDEFDLAPWLGHWPQALPVRLTRGRIGADLTIDFDAPPGQTPAIRLAGRLGVHDIALTDRHDHPLLAWGALDVALRDVQPLARQVTLGAVTLDGLTLDLARDAQGRLNLAQLAAAEPAPAAVPTAASAASSVAPAPAATPWRIALDALALQNTRLHWQDATTRPAARLVLDDLRLETGAVQWPLQAPVTIKAATALNTPAQGRLEIGGEAGTDQARLDLTLDRLALAALEPYLASTLQPRLSGELSAHGRLTWAAATASAPMQLALTLQQGTLDALRLSARDAAAGAPALAALGRLQVDDASVDVAARRVSLGAVQLVQPDTRLARGSDGRWNVLGWLANAPTPATTSTTTPVPPAPKPAAAAPPWRLDLKSLQLRDGHLQFEDAPTGTGTLPVQLDIGRLQVALQNVSLQGERTLAPLRWQIAADVQPSAAAQARARQGKAPVGPRAPTLDARGELASLQPLALTGALKMQALPVHALEPYFGEAAGVRLLRARLGYQGDIALQDGPAGLTVSARGDARLGDVLVHTRRATGTEADELLSWQTLALQGLDVALKPAQRPRVALREIALDDFYARLMITEDGRFNLKDVGASRPAGQDAAPAAPTASAPPPPASAPAAVAPAPELPVDLSLGGTRLSRGRVDFTDRFIRPNYSADLSELEGTLGPFRTGSREMATLALRGRIARTGSLDIAGRVNPLVRPPALDVRARATDLELTPLSPYAGKYAGYGIERGKLGMDVSYRIGDDGRLDARNQLVINQLTFGDRVDSPDATQLPVLLAVALLKDSHGNIDLDIPISGSLNDPQFSVFGLVLKVIGNVLVKAVTAPFALLTGGGAEDLNRVAFEPGTATLRTDSLAALDKVARALQDRPALNVTVTGQAHDGAERTAWQAAALERRLQTLWRRERAKAGPTDDEATDTPTSPPAAVPATERLRLLRQVLKTTRPAATSAAAAPLPRADLPEAELAAALAALQPIGAEDWRQLAQQRADAVRDALLARQLANDRLYLAAPKVLGDPAAATGWVPHAEMTLSTR